MVAQSDLQPIVLPNTLIRWATPTLVGTFVQFNVYRRIVPETSWTRIATIADVAELFYRDYAVPPRKVVEYAITQTENIGGVLLESAFPTPVQGYVQFNWAYLHSIFDPTQFVVFFSLDISEDVAQDVQLRTAWGRSEPTAFIGELDALTFRMSGLPDIIRGTVWAARNLSSLQVDDADVYCLRLGIEAERHFVNITSLSRRIGNRDYQPDMGVAEVFYEEAV